MPTETPEHNLVEEVILAEEADRNVAHATVRIGEILIRGIAIWRGSNGRLQVHFPSRKSGYSWEECVHLPEELRTRVEAEVIASYRDAKASAKKKMEG